MHEICVVGFGALGALYSFVLERSGKARVTAVCRSNYSIVKEHGIDIASEKFGNEPAWKPHRVVSAPTDAADRQYNFIVCCFKALPDVITTPALLGPLLPKTKTFVLLQNGIGIERDLQRAAPGANVISGCCWIDATVVGGGRKVEHFNVETLTLGIHYPKHLKNSAAPAVVTESLVTKEVDGPEAPEALAVFVDLLTLGGANPDPQLNIEAERWRKLLWNAAYSTLCTISRASVPELFSAKVYPLVAPAVRGIMEEVVRVARAAGVDGDQLPDAAIDDTIALTLSIYEEDPSGQRVPKPFRPSMLVDLDQGRPMEVEAIVGGPVKIARELGVLTPQLDVVYATLKVMQNAILTASRSGPSASAS